MSLPKLELVVTCRSGRRIFLEPKYLDDMTLAGFVVVDAGAKPLRADELADARASLRELVESRGLTVNAR